MRQRVTEIYADGLENLRRPRVTLAVEVLHDLELLGRMPGRQRDSGSGREANHRLLREILHAAPEVTRPFVRRGARIVVDRRKRQFV